MNHRIGEIAQEAGVTVEAVRYYERIGLLPRAPRTHSGVRRYPPDTVDHIRFVKQAQRNGFTLAEVRELLALTRRGGVKRCRQVHQLLTAKLAEIDHKRTQLEAFRRTLQAQADECARSLREDSDPDCPVIGKIGRVT